MSIVNGVCQSNRLASRVRPDCLHVPIVPIKVNASVATSTLYIDTLFDPEFVT